MTFRDKIYNAKTIDDINSVLLALFRESERIKIIIKNNKPGYMANFQFLLKYKAELSDLSREQLRERQRNISYPRVIKPTQAQEEEAHALFFEAAIRDAGRLYDIQSKYFTRMNEYYPDGRIIPQVGDDVSKLVGSGLSGLRYAQGNVVLKGSVKKVKVVDSPINMPGMVKLSDDWTVFYDPSKNDRHIIGGL